MTPPKPPRTAGIQAGSCEFFLTSYMLGGPDGRNLGAPGYSHEFVARLFRPLLERMGPVSEIRDARRDLQAAVDACTRRGRRPVHFSVLPFQDVTLARQTVDDWGGMGGRDRCDRRLDSPVSLWDCRLVVMSGLPCCYQYSGLLIHRSGVIIVPGGRESPRSDCYLHRNDY